MFNVGITCIGYECSELLPRAFEPWRKIRSGEEKVREISRLYISMSHGSFEETAKLGFPIDSTDKSHEYMRSLLNSGQIDNFIHYSIPQKEYDMWTGNYLFFKDKIDVMVMLNHDEIWSIDEIKKLFKIIAYNKEIDYFKINFKNYCINERTWVDDFIVPRVWFTKKNQGLSRFYKDELVEYNNGLKDVQCSYLAAPKSYLFPKHLSWVGSKEYLKRKLAFQALRFGSCSYAWDDKKDELCLNENFYAKFGIQKPVLNYE